MTPRLCLDVLCRLLAIPLRLSSLGENIGGNQQMAALLSNDGRALTCSHEQQAMRRALLSNNAKSVSVLRRLTAPSKVRECRHEIHDK
jgi:hypothetical protein